jgi:hypothetical protein
VGEIRRPRLAKPKDGLYGRIAISIFRAKPSIIYAQVEAGASAGTGGGTTAEGGPAPPGFRSGAQESSGPAGQPRAVTPESAAAAENRGANTPPPNPNGSGVFRSENGGKAAQYFFKSSNRGGKWTMNTTDLTKHFNRWNREIPIMNSAGDKPRVAKHDGYSSNSLATQIRESPSKPGVIWIGTDDGNLQLSQDGGKTFTNVYGNITDASKGYVQISRIEPFTLIQVPLTSRLMHTASTTGRPTFSRPTTDKRGRT